MTVRRLNAIFVALAAAGSLCGQSSSRNPTDYDVEAAYLSNFGRFVQWPAGADPPAGPQPSGGEPVSGSPDHFGICVLGSDPFGRTLDRAVAGESINRAPLVAKRIARVQDAAGCRILFIPASEDNQLRSILARLGNAGVLTVGESPEFIKSGGMIQFVVEGNRVRFEVNLAAVQRAHLSLSSELTKLAVAVRSAP